MQPIGGISHYSLAESPQGKPDHPPKCLYYNNNTSLPHHHCISIPKTRSTISFIR